MYKTLIIIPTYNEFENIESILNKVLSVMPNIEILVVDDNSSDGTREYVEELSEKEERVHIINRRRKMGLGTAYKDGFRYALAHGYDYVFEMDADFSHNPNDIPRFLEYIKRYDLVVGSRYSNGVSVINWPISRLLLSYLANLYARLVTDVPVRDLTSGFKCYRREVIEKMNLDRIKSDGYGFQIETVFWSYVNGFRVKEMPIIFVDRLYGTSKMSKKIVWEAFWVVWRLRLSRLFHRRKRNEG